MKKALVLGVLALFAFSVSNVNAQNKTNVQQKKAAKGETVEIKDAKKDVQKEEKTFQSANEVKTATKDVNAQGVKKEKKEKKFGKGTGTMKAEEGAVSNTTKAVTNQPTGKEKDCCKAEKKACEGKSNDAKVDPASKQVKPGFNNSVPPKPKNDKEKKAASSNVNNASK